MRSMRIVTVLIFVLTVNAVAQPTLTGVWRTVVTPGQPRNRMPTMFGEVVLDLQADGARLTGTARMGDGWPGLAPVQNGKVDANRFSFEWTGTIAASGGVPLASRFPHLTFTGTIDGARMTLSMDGDYTMALQGERLQRP